MPKCDFTEVAKDFSNWFSLEVFFSRYSKEPSKFSSAFENFDIFRDQFNLIHYVFLIA